jgi:hypothetical protein
MKNFITLILIILKFDSLGVELGDGIDFKRLSLSRNKCVNGEKVYSGSRESIFKFDIVKNDRFNHARLFLDAGVDIDLFLVGGSVNSELLVIDSDRKNTISMELYFSLKNRWERFLSPELSEQLNDRIRQLSSTSLKTKICGDSYITAIQRGVIFRAQVLAAFDDIHQLNRFKVTARASVGPFSKSKSKTFIKEARRQGGKISYHLLQVGGIAEKAAELRSRIPRECKAQDDLEYEKCAKHVDDIFGYVSTIEEQGSSPDAVIDISVQPFADLFPGLDIPEFTLSTERARLVNDQKSELHKALLLGQTYENQIKEIRSKIRRLYFTSN